MMAATGEQENEAERAPKNMAVERGLRFVELLVGASRHQLRFILPTGQQDEPGGIAGRRQPLVHRTRPWRTPSRREW